MLQDAMFSVKEVPATMVNEEGELNHIGNTGYKFIVREDNSKVLSCMTNSYKLVKNETIMNIAEPLIKKIRR